jgi:hypothetical protein
MVLTPCPVWNKNGGGRRLATHTVTPVSILQLIQYKEESGPFQANSIIISEKNATYKEPIICFISPKSCRLIEGREICVIMD